MNPLSFKEYLRMLDEDADSDLANLTIKKQQLIVRKTNAITPIDSQINPTKTKSVWNVRSNRVHVLGVHGSRTEEQTKTEHC